MPAVAGRGGPGQAGPADPAAFILANTRLTAFGIVPEIRLQLADDPWKLWEAAERAFGGAACPVLAPPFWAFAWAGGQALARYVLDHPELVRGRRVLDIATGSGLVAIAAARCGAATVTALDIDPLAVAAVKLNAAANGVTVAVRNADLTDHGTGLVDPAGTGQPAVLAVLVADAFYEKTLADRVMQLLDRAAPGAATTLVADIGRRYLPRERFRELAAYEVPVLALDR